MSRLGVELPQSVRDHKALLVNPVHAEWGHTPPLGLAYIAGILEDRGVAVDVADMCAYGMDMTGIEAELRRSEASIVGITATTPQIHAAWEIAGRAKRVLPGCRVVLGGVHPTSLPDESLRNPHVDFVVRGEGELTILELVRALCGGTDLAGIRGLSFRDNGGITHNPPRPLIRDLDSLPFPARHLFPFPEAYRSPMLKRRVFADIMTSRGCPGACIFCNHTVFGHRFRARSPEDVVREIEYLQRQFGVGELHIADDSFSYDGDRAMSICDLITEGNLDIAWSCSGGIRVDCISRELLVKMKRAGCYRVHFGVESGSSEVLRKVGKGITLEGVRQAFRLAREVGMITVALFMLGNYGENRQTMQETIDFARSLDTDFAQFTMAVPFPGTPFHRLLDKRGQLLTKDWRQYEIYDRPVFQTDDLTGSLVAEMYRKAHRQYYFRPGYVLRRLRRLRSLNDVRTALVGLAEIVRRAGTGRRLTMRVYTPSALRARFSNGLRRSLGMTAKLKG